MLHDQVKIDGQWVCTENCPTCFAEKSANEPWLTTFTGKKVNPFKLLPEDISIEDIAHHLATLNRWCGALHEPISIAQHAWHVSKLCEDTGHELIGLNHDNAEAYFGDMTKWVKHSLKMTEYRRAEHDAHIVICKALGIQTFITQIVEDADKLMIGIEGSFGIKGWRPFPGYRLPTEDELEKSRFDGSWDWRTAERRFLDRYEVLKLRSKP